MESLSLMDANKPERVKSAINELIAFKNNTPEPTVITKESLGLGNVDNTKDADKPVSTLQKKYIDEKDSGNLKKESENPQTINSDLILGEDKKLCGNRGNDTVEELASISNKDGFENVEMGSDHIPLRLHHNMKDINGTVVEKNPKIKITDENGDSEEDYVALASDLEGCVKTKTAESFDTPNGLVTCVECQSFEDTAKDLMNLRVIVRNVKTGEVLNDTTIPLKMASEQSRGLMSKEDYATLNNLINRVASIEGRCSRYLYTEKTNPSASDIEKFVSDLNIEIDNYANVAIIVASTYHVWHYYENGGWQDDGSDTVNRASNSSLGVVIGSNEEGKIFVETDGSMSVVGWDKLRTELDAKLDTGEVQSLIDDSIETSVTGLLGGSY